MFTGTSVKMSKALLERVRTAAAKSGYSSVEEFVEHAVEKELLRIEESEAVTRQLKGLGYLE